MSLTCYIPFTLYAYRTDDNTMFEKVKDIKEAGASIGSGSSQQTTSLIVQHLIQVIMKFFSASNKYSTILC